MGLHHDSIFISASGATALIPTDIRGAMSAFVHFTSAYNPGADILEAVTDFRL